MKIMIIIIIDIFHTAESIIVFQESHMFCDIEGIADLSRIALFFILIHIGLNVYHDYML